LAIQTDQSLIVGELLLTVGELSLTVAAKAPKLATDSNDADIAFRVRPKIIYVSRLLQ